MLSHPVRLEVAVQFSKRPGKIGLLAGPGDAAFRITDDRLLAIDDVRQRAERQEDGGRIAAGIGDQPRRLQFAVTPLGQPIDSLIEKRRALVREAVPRRIEGGIVETKRAR